MVTRSASRKLKRGRDASQSPVRQASSAEEGQAQVAQAMSSQPPPPRTPGRRNAKRVRVSDPGPSTRATTAGRGNNTGLTPAISRTSINVSDANMEPATPSRRRPRRSAPARQGNDILIDPVLPHNSNENTYSTAPVNIQFTPLRQRLDKRMQRRLFRFGLSDHMNILEQEDRTFKKHLALLKQELVGRQAVRDTETVQSDQFDTMVVDDSTMDGDIVVSMSPILRVSHQDETIVREPISTAMSPLSMEEVVTEQASLHEQPVIELQKASADLEDAQKQKESFFRHWQRLQDTEIGTAICSTLPKVPETPDELMQLGIPIMESMFQKFYDAMKSLEETRIALSNMGFSGDNVEELLYDVHETFFYAHRYLESLVPEEALSDPSDGKTTLEVLLIRLKEVTDEFVKVKQHRETLTEDCNGIQQRYDDTLRIVQEQTTEMDDLKRRVASLTEQNESLVQDMLHNRILVQSLKNDIRGKEVALERFRRSLATYHEENKRYQETIEHLEQTLNISTEKYEILVAELETQLTAREEDFRRRYEGQLTVVIRQQLEQEFHTESQSPGGQISRNTEERDEKLRSFQEQTQQLERLSQALSDTRERAARLERANESLVGQIESQAQDFEELGATYERAIPVEQRESIAEAQRRVETRFSNWNSEYQRILSGGVTAPQSEPPTPFGRGGTDQNTNFLETPNSAMSDDTDSGLPIPFSGSESTTPIRRRLFSNVRVGRGKDRRYLDSGIGPSSEAGFGLADSQTSPTA
ncbi:hypothetical protein PISL3812_07075 [Talaromyces islandicus]|uniref:Uncharacterized protein n=1 Tax=Talaromyces islandicus TaxID=28573 RepID=A0A0U1M3D8_TALIS|nr:hypothetical protein PISL3812_07075 [Talaromyces islandicus]